MVCVEPVESVSGRRVFVFVLQFAAASSRRNKTTDDRLDGRYVLKKIKRYGNDRRRRVRRPNFHDGSRTIRRTLSNFVLK